MTRQTMTTAESTASGALSFADRHIGPRAAEIEQMLEALGQSSLASLIDAAVPAAIRSDGSTGGLELPPPASEAAALVELDEIAAGNQVLRSFIGMGYHGCVTPPG